MRTFSLTTLTTGWTDGRTDGQKIAKQFTVTLGLCFAARVNDLAGFCILKFKSPNTSLIKFCITFAKVYVSLNQVNSSAASVAFYPILIDVFTSMPQLSLSTTLPALSMEYTGREFVGAYFTSQTPYMIK